LTGACGVLGTTIVEYSAAQGCKVVLLDLDRMADKGKQLVAGIKADGVSM
jgi:3-hydroxyacyl-CoA dehydrogenase